MAVIAAEGPDGVDDGIDDCSDSELDTWEFGPMFGLPEPMLAICDKEGKTVHPIADVGDEERRGSIAGGRIISLGMATGTFSVPAGNPHIFAHTPAPPERPNMSLRAFGITGGDVISVTPPPMPPPMKQLSLDAYMPRIDGSLPGPCSAAEERHPPAKVRYTKMQIDWAIAEHTAELNNRGWATWHAIPRENTGGWWKTMVERGQAKGVFCKYANYDGVRSAVQRHLKELKEQNAAAASASTTTDAKTDRDGKKGKKDKTDKHDNTDKKEKKDNKAKEDKKCHSDTKDAKGDKDKKDKIDKHDNKDKKEKKDKKAKEDKKCHSDTKDAKGDKDKKANTDDKCEASNTDTRCGKRQHSNVDGVGGSSSSSCATVRQRVSAKLID